MTSELEQQFFRVFGIEKKCNRETLKFCVGDLDCNTCKSPFYPKITAEKLLVLLCIVIDEYNRNGRTFYLDSTNVKELKEEILDALMGCIDATCDLFETEVNQIQQLFKEDE